MKCGLHQFIFQRRHADTSIALTTRPLPFESGSLLIAGGAAGRTAVIHLPFIPVAPLVAHCCREKGSGREEGSGGHSTPAYLVFCETITLYYPHFCIIFSTQLIPGDITWNWYAYWISLGFFYVVICLDNIFADSSIMLIDHLGHRIAVLKLSFFDLVHPFFFFGSSVLSQMPLAMRIKSWDPTPAYFSVLSKERFTHLSSIL